MAISRNRGFILGPLSVSIAHAWPGGEITEPVTVWGNGLLHRGYAIRLAPWRQGRGADGPYLLAGPALVLAWRL